MDLRHLRYFVAVAEEGNMTRAAERLGIQQPPLSQQIKALETELKVQLFRRKPRGLELTPAGTALLAETRVILDQIAHAVSRAQSTARGTEGAIAIGFTSSAPFHPFVTRAIRSFREDHPGVSVTLRESSSVELLEDLRQDRIDVAFVRRGTTEPGLTIRPLVREAMVAALPAGHKLAAAEADLPLAELAEETFVLYHRPATPGLFEEIAEGCRAAGFSPQIGQVAPRIVSALNLVAAGLGVSIVPESLARMQLDGIVYRPLAGRPALAAQLNLATRKLEPSQAVKTFAAVVLALGRDRQSGRAVPKLTKTP